MTEDRHKKSRPLERAANEKITAPILCTSKTTKRNADCKGLI